MAHFSQYKKSLYDPNPPVPHNCQIVLQNGEKELAHKNILAAESILFENQADWLKIKNVASWHVKKI